MGTLFGTVVGRKTGSKVIVAVAANTVREIELPPGAPMPVAGDDVAMFDPAHPEDADILKAVAAKMASGYSTAWEGQGAVVISRSEPPTDPVLAWAVGLFEQPEVAALRDGPGYTLVADPTAPWRREDITPETLQAAVPYAASDRWGARCVTALTDADEETLALVAGTRGAFSSTVELPTQDGGRWTAALVVPYDPTLTGLGLWRAMGGHDALTMPKTLVSAQDAFRFASAHELAHRHQAAFGFLLPDDHASEAENTRRRLRGEFFADAAAVMLLALHGGAPETAATIAASRAARDPGQGVEHCTGAACVAAVARVREILQSGQPVPSVADILAEAAVIARETPSAVLDGKFWFRMTGIERERTSEGKAVALDRAGAEADLMGEPDRAAYLRLASKAWKRMLGPGDLTANPAATTAAMAADLADGMSFMLAAGAPSAAEAMRKREEQSVGWMPENEFKASLIAGIEQGAAGAASTPLRYRGPGRLFASLASGVNDVASGGQPMPGAGRPIR